MDVSDGLETATASVTVTVTGAVLGEPVFATPVSNPFGLTGASSEGGFAPAIVDLDDDGDLDVLAGGYYDSLQYFQNTGSPAALDFEAPVVNPFGLVAGGTYGFPAFADLDDDGDQDLLLGVYGYPADLLYYENIGSATAPDFDAPQTNPFGLVPYASYTATPAFADLDDDGDYDLLVGEYGYASLRYYENTGSRTSPSFGSPQENPFGITAGYMMSTPALADVDGDGDLDLLVGGYGDPIAGFEYFENTGTPGSPAFADAVANPFGLTAVATYFAIPAFADLDDDGDLDLLVGSWYGGDTWYFENTLR